MVENCVVCGAACVHCRTHRLNEMQIKANAAAAKAEQDGGCYACTQYLENAPRIDGRHSYKETCGYVGREENLNER